MYVGINTNRHVGACVDMHAFRSAYTWQYIPIQSLKSITIRNMTYDAFLSAASASVASST